MRSDLLRAELRVLELEAAFVAAKESGEVTREQREGLRAARQEFRTLRAGDPQFIEAAGNARPDGVRSASAVTGDEG